MGQYCYLINKEKKISVEAYKLTGGGEEVLRIEEPDELTRFLEYCRSRELKIECVSEHFFSDSDIEFVDFKKYR